MAYKIYGKGNYLFIDDTETGLRHEQLKKNVFVQKELATSTTYRIDPVKNVGGIRLILVSTDILKENGTPYTDAEWVTFYTENTGNFNGGAGGSQTVVVDNYAALPLPSAAVDEFYFVKNSQGTKWLPGSLGGTYYTNGLYYSDGVEWFYTNLPYQASLSQVNLGTNTSEFLTPYTFDNSNKILNSFQKNVDDSDDITEGVVNKFDLNFVFNQGVAATTWTVAHNLGKFPSVSVIDSMGTAVIGQVNYIDNNNLTINFNAAFSGKAFIN
jgi:hypothetical protein